MFEKLWQLALAKGKPEYDTQFIDGKQRKVIKINDKIYMT